MRRFDKLRLLPWQKRRVLLYAWLLLNTIRLSLWLFSFGTVRQQLSAAMSLWVCRETVKPVSVGFIVWAVTVAGRYSPLGAKCLARALTTQLLLNRYGYQHNLHIGVAKSDSQMLEAHAWIEYQGQVVVGGLSNLSRFKPLSAAGTRK
jgi:hypothetical protein